MRRRVETCAAKDEHVRARAKTCAHVRKLKETCAKTPRKRARTCAKKASTCAKPSGHVRARANAEGNVSRRGKEHVRARAQEKKRRARGKR